MATKRTHYEVLGVSPQATEKEIIEHCAAKLAPYEVPRRISFIAELPKTTVGKTLRRELVRPEYQQDFLSRALDRIQRLFQEAAGAAADAGVASYAAALVVFLLLGLCMLWLVSRARASAAVARRRP